MPKCLDIIGVFDVELSWDFSEKKIFSHQEFNKHGILCILGVGGISGSTHKMCPCLLLLRDVGIPIPVDCIWMKGRKRNAGERRNADLSADLLDRMNAGQKRRVCSPGMRPWP